MLAVNIIHSILSSMDIPELRSFHDSCKRTRKKLVPIYFNGQAIPVTRRGMVRHIQNVLQEKGVSNGKTEVACE